MKDIPQLRVKEICKEKGMTLKQLAEKMDIAPETLTRAISENANPTLVTLNKIASSLGVGFDDLLIASRSANQIYGHIEANGEVYRIRNLTDLEVLCDKLRKQSNF